MDESTTKKAPRRQWNVAMNDEERAMVRELQAVLGSRVPSTEGHQTSEAGAVRAAVAIAHQQLCGNGKRKPGKRKPV